MRSSKAKLLRRPINANSSKPDMACFYPFHVSERPGRAAVAYRWFQAQPVQLKCTPK